MKIRDPITREILERALENKVKGLSSKEREKILEEEATRLLNYDSREQVKYKVEGIPVKMLINENKVVDSIAAAYLASPNKYNFR
jgi:hypothetical protein